MDGIAITQVVDDDIEPFYTDMNPSNLVVNYPYEPALCNESDNSIPMEDIERMIVLNEGNAKDVDMETSSDLDDHDIGNVYKKPPSPVIGSPNFKHIVKLTPFTTHPSLKKRAQLSRVAENSQISGDERDIVDDTKKDAYNDTKTINRMLLDENKLLKRKCKAWKREIKVWEKRCEKLKKYERRLNKTIAEKLDIVRKLEAAGSIKRRGRKYGNGKKWEKILEDVGDSIEESDEEVDDVDSDSPVDEDQSTVPLSLSSRGRPRKLRKMLQGYFSKRRKIIPTLVTPTLLSPSALPAKPAPIGPDGLPIIRRRGRPPKPRPPIIIQPETQVSNIQPIEEDLPVNEKCTEVAANNDNNESQEKGKPTTVNNRRPRFLVGRRGRRKYFTAKRRRKMHSVVAEEAPKVVNEVHEEPTFTGSPADSSSADGENIPLISSKGAIKRRNVRLSQSDVESLTEPLREKNLNSEASDNMQPSVIIKKIPLPNQESQLSNKQEIKSVKSGSSASGDPMKSEFDTDLVCSASKRRTSSRVAKPPKNNEFEYNIAKTFTSNSPKKSEIKIEATTEDSVKPTIANSPIKDSCAVTPKAKRGKLVKSFESEAQIITENCDVAKSPKDESLTIRIKKTRVSKSSNENHSTDIKPDNSQPTELISDCSKEVSGGQRRSSRTVRITKKLAGMIEQEPDTKLGGFTNTLNRSTSGNEDLLKIEKEKCSWQPGDLVWASFGEIHFWPAIVCQDPFDNDQFSKFKLLGKEKQMFVHVQFLHDKGRRAWSPSFTFIPFKGLNDFHHVAQIYSSSKNTDISYSKSAFEIPEKSSKLWRDAVQLSETLEAKTPVERLAYMRNRHPMERYGDITLNNENVADVESSPPKPVPILQPPAARVSNGRKSEISDKRKRPSSTELKPPLPNKKPKTGKKSDATAERNVRATSVASDSSAFTTSSLESLEEISRNVKKAKNYMFKGIGNEKMCDMCCALKNEQTIKCNGVCCGYFHKSCVEKQTKSPVKSPRKNTPTTVPDDWKCSYCSIGQNPCFICKDNIGARQMCLTAGCGKFYHKHCLKLFPQTKFNHGPKKNIGLQLNANGKHDEPPLEILACARHTCHTCCSDNPAEATILPPNQLLYCIKCATSYHCGNYCIPAGTEVLTTNTILCGKHFDPGKIKTSYHVNINWCFICTKGGSLICCDTCPSSIHAECLKIAPPEDGYVCDECESGRFPLYGEIVWAKLGNYRWWPSRVVYPHEIPEKLLNYRRRRCEFAVQFYGTDNYNYFNRGRVFLYNEGDSQNNFRVTKRLDNSFQKALNEAAAAFEKRKDALSHWTGVTKSKPASYTKIRINKYKNKRMHNINRAEEPQVCECSSTEEDPCGPLSNCLNRSLLIECSSAFCSAGARCNNQRFDKRQYAPLKLIKTKDRGWGVQSTIDLVKGQFIIEYVGEVIDDQELRVRMKIKGDAKDSNYYFLRLDNNRIIDAGPMGNTARFINHSCSPNCETQKWTVNKTTRIGIFALTDIPSGTELTFNYDMDYLDNKSTCYCGSERCSGFIGESNKKKEKSETTVKKQPKKVGKKGKSRKSRNVERLLSKEFETTCFVCNLDSDLMMNCHGPNCTRVAHPECCGLREPPAEPWICKRHNCNVCDAQTKQMCATCDNAYCSRHTEGKIQTEGQKMICFACKTIDVSDTNSRKSAYLKRHDADSLSISSLDNLAPAVDVTDVDVKTPCVLLDPNGEEILVEPEIKEEQSSVKKKRRTNLSRSKLFENS